MNPENTENLKLVDAVREDVSAVKALLESVNLPVDGVEEHLTNFILLKKEKKVIGAVGLESYGGKALLRSLAVADAYQGMGYGQKLYRGIIEKARLHSISEIYLLTETAETFFTRQGFTKISREFVDAAVKESVEFRTVCPESASCMQLKIEESNY